MKLLHRHIIIHFPFQDHRRNVVFLLLLIPSQTVPNYFTSFFIDHLEIPLCFLWVVSKVMRMIYGRPVFFNYDVTWK